MLTAERKWLRDFVRESNWIEGIFRLPTEQEIEASASFLALFQPSVLELCNFVEACEPGARLRDQIGLGVRVGDYIAPPGSLNIRRRLKALLTSAYQNTWSPFKIHLQYEMLHPFTDGNGRSGRIIWAWQMRNNGEEISLPFLQHFYYQTLGETRC